MKKKIKWTGLSPVTNIFGDWKPGETKLVPENTNLPNFDNVEETKPTMPFKKKVFNKTVTMPVVKIQDSNLKVKKRKMFEKYNDKFERKNYNIEKLGGN